MSKSILYIVESAVSPKYLYSFLCANVLILFFFIELLHMDP